MVQVNVNKLTHSSKPTTAPIGTDRVIAALHTLAHRHSVSLVATRLLSRSAGARQRVRADDDAATISGQWAAIRSAFEDSNTVLLYHLENHYSLVYALREWAFVGSVVDGEERLRLVRQLLVAKPGQSPNRWLALEDVRACVLGWSGYALLQVVRD